MEVPRNPAAEKVGLSQAHPLRWQLPHWAQVCHLLPRCVLIHPQRAAPGPRQARNDDVVVGK